MYVELQDFESNRRPYLDGLARSAGFRPFQELSAQTDISGVCCKWLEVAGNDWNVCKWLEIAGNYWNGWKWLEIA